MLLLLEWQRDMRNDNRPDEREASWKVLLPFHQESRILAVGIGAGALCGLFRTFKQVDNSPNGCMYDIIVFGDQKLDSQMTDKCLSHLSSNGVIVSLGLSKVRDSALQAQWRCVAEYACLPPKHPRIFIPLALKQVRNSGLDFHSPGSLLNKIWLWGAKGLSNIGITSHLGHRRVSFFTANGQMDGEGSVQQWIAQKIDWPVDEIIIYAGSESPARKITALCMSFDGRKRIVAKISDTGLATAAIKLESAALRVLAKSTLAGAVPAFITEGEWGPYFIQLQSCLPKVRGQRKTLSDAHIGFLSTLSKINRRQVQFYRTAVWQMVSEVAVSPIGGKFPDVIRRIASRLVNDNSIASTIVTSHMVHGDFAPWNIFCQNSSILVYDWEACNLNGLSLHDVFHFIFRQASLIGPWPGSEAILNMMRDAAATLAKKSGIQCDVNIMLASWCIQEYFSNPSPRLIELADGLERI